MDRFLQVEFVGLPSSLGWSHVVTTPAAGEARCLFCFAVRGPQASSVGHELSAIIRSRDLTDEQQLYELVIALNARAQDLGVRLSLAAGFVGAVSGAWITLGGVVGLLRAGRFGTVVSSADLDIRSGAVRPGDVFVLATASGGELLEDVAELFQQGYRLEGVESSLERLIRTQPGQDASALALLQRVELDRDADALASSQPEGQLIGRDGSPPPTLSSLADIAVIEIDARHTTVQTAVAPAAGERVGETAAVDLAPTQPSATPDDQRAPAGDFDPKRNQDLSHESSPPAAALLLKSGWQRSASLLSAGVSGVRRVGISLWVRVTAVAHTVLRNLRRLPWGVWWRSKAVRLGLIASLSVLVVMAAIVVTLRWQHRRAQAAAASVVDPLRTQLTSIQARAAQDPLQAQQALDELGRAVNEKMTVATPPATTKALQAFLDEIYQYKGTLKGERAVSALPAVFDLQSVVPGFVTTLADSLAEVGLYVDVSKKVAVLANLATKETKQFDLGSLKTITAVSLRSPREAVILSDGVYSLSLESTSSPQLVKPAGDSNKAATLISSYDAYTYLFNPDKRNIFRYLVRKDGYSDPVGWLLSPLGIPAESVVSMQVDGDVWLGTKDGKVKKLTSGRVTGFEPTNLDQPLTGPLQVYVEPDDQYLYVLVPAQQRVVVLTKDGAFIKQIKSEILATATSIAVNEAAGYLYAVSGSIVYQAPL